MTADTAFTDPNVEKAFDAFPEKTRQTLMEVRELIFKTAKNTPKAGRISEELRWGQPAYITPETKSGSTIRLGVLPDKTPAIFAHCQTSIISDFAATTLDDKVVDNRAIVLDPASQDQRNRLIPLIRHALTYHL